jgi:lipoyl(octanoyl) transferase
MNQIEFKDLGLIEYSAAWDYQRLCFDKAWQDKKDKIENNPSQYLLFCEHSHVYTIGKSGNDGNLLVNEYQLKSYGATLFHIDRGGDITYHGPGQIVAYPIFDLQRMKIGVKDYVHKLEEVVIRTLEKYGINAGRLEGATGVWLDSDTPKARKICAIGVKASHFITMHGFAFNINTDLNFFNYINPCGFTDKGVTSLSKELKKPINLEEVKQEVKSNFFKIFELKTD